MISIDEFFSTLKKQKNAWKGEVVLVGGCFDVLHYGHVYFLEFAKKQGSTLVIALESDEFIRQRKHREPVHNALKRAEVLKALRSVDEVITLPFLSQYQEYARLVETVQPSVIALTENDPQLKNKTKQAEKISARIAVCKYIAGFSTSTIVGSQNK